MIKLLFIKKPGQNLDNTWTKPGQSLNKTWTKPGHNLNKTCIKPGKNLYKTWKKPGHNLNITWKKPEQNLDKTWITLYKTWTKHEHTLDEIWMNLILIWKTSLYPNLIHIHTIWIKRHGQYYDPLLCWIFCKSKTFGRKQSQKVCFWFAYMYVSCAS